MNWPRRRPKTVHVVTVWNGVGDPHVLVCFRNRKQALLVSDVLGHSWTWVSVTALDIDNPYYPKEFGSGDRALLS
jgi:hypothetical protein